MTVALTMSFKLINVKKNLSVHSVRVINQT